MRDSTPEREKALKIHGRYNEALKSLAEDRDLSDDGRSRRQADLYAASRRELEQLQAGEQERLSRRQRELEQRLFGRDHLDQASDAISVRDAQDRAERLTSPSEAAELLRRAEDNSDSALARAVARHAGRRADEEMLPAARDEWSAVLSSFIEARPGVMPIVEELAQIERLSQRQVLSPFSLAQPTGALSSDINAAQQAVSA